MSGQHDVVVVGARCAGAPTAMLLARQGHNVVLVDRADFPSDTLSTHALARGAMVQLARWGLLDTVAASGAPPIRTVSFHLPDSPVVHRTVKDRAGIDYLLAPRRYHLDTILVTAAVAASATFHSGVSVTGTVRDRSGRVVGIAARDRDGRRRHYRGRFVVGADGLRSRVARSVGAAITDQRPSSAATHYAYVAGLDTSGFEFHLAPASFAGVFPTHDGQANVWVSHPADALTASGYDRARGFLSLLERTSPSLAARVAAATITSPVRGAVRLPNQVRAAAGPGWALVGDAGYHRDPITGHGITDAFRDAELLARQLDRALRGEISDGETLRTYANQRDHALAPIFDITCRLAQFPPLPEFSALQKQLSQHIDAEAAALTSLPRLPRAEPVAA